MKMTLPSRRPRRRGIFLMEMLWYGVMIGAVALVVGDFLLLLMRATNETQQRDTMIARVDSAFDVLRRDAWAARAFRPMGDSVEIELPGGNVVWRAAPGGLSRIQPGQPPRNWVGMPAIRFWDSAPGAGDILVVSVESGPGGAATHEEIKFISQRMLAGGAK